MTEQLISYKGVRPTYDDPIYLLPTSLVIGDVVMGSHCSFWPHTVVRGDMNFIRMGSYTNIQDNSVVHVTNETAPTHIGSYVTVGHSCIIHGCTIQDRVLIGMGSIIMDHANIGSDCIIGAGSLVTENTVIPEGMLAFGRPAKPIRPLTEKEKAIFMGHAQRYVDTAQAYQ